jgi:CRISPR-associated endonuclease Cas3-HD
LPLLDCHALLHFWGKTDSSLDCHALLHFWGKTDSSDHDARPKNDFHPLAFHLLDVAACAGALLDANPARLMFLADVCGIEPEKLRRLLVCLVALHDIGKCARGFQGKVPELWPSALGPRPEQEKFIPVRHDAAGLWLFMNEPRLTAVGKRLMPGLLASDREKIFQSVVGHHGEPLELDFRGNVAAIRNSEVHSPDWASDVLSVGRSRASICAAPLKAKPCEAARVASAGAKIQAGTYLCRNQRYKKTVGGKPGASLEARRPLANCTGRASMRRSHGREGR